jgi:hypothetical protein
MINYLLLASNMGISGFERGDELRAKCPLHSDRSPSFSLNLKNGAWICFKGCGSGSFYSLVELVYGMNPSEARAWIESNGVSVDVTKSISELEKQLFDVVVTQEPKETNWKDHYLGLAQDRMSQWFLDRGITWGTINHWDIRYDMVFDAVVIPVKWQGELIGTVTRNTMLQPRYKNSKDLPKSEILFGEINRNLNNIIVCEGAIDLLWLWQNGYNAFGLLGSELSQRQVDLLRTYRFGEIILAFDNDDAGREGSRKATSLLFKNGWMPQQITQITFPTNIKDPNDCSPELLTRLFDQRTSAFQFTI